MSMVEYDMDSEDEAWLDEFNTGRKREGLAPVDEDEFENVIDKLEKETFKWVCQPVQVQVLHSNISIVQQNNTGEVNAALPVAENPDDVCSVCLDGTSDDTNQILYCDGCDIAVHQGMLLHRGVAEFLNLNLECYGVALIPELQWLCQKCESDEKDTLVLCIIFYNSLHFFISNIFYATITSCSD